MSNVLEYKGYFAEIHFNAEDEVLHGKLIGISDLVAFEGTSVKGIKRAFWLAVQDYLDTCIELEKEPQKPQE